MQRDNERFSFAPIHAFILRNMPDSRLCCRLYPKEPDECVAEGILGSRTKYFALLCLQDAVLQRQWSNRFHAIPVAFVGI